MKTRIVAISSVLLSIILMSQVFDYTIMIVTLIFHRNDSNEPPRKEEHVVGAMSFRTTLKDYVLSRYLNEINGISTYHVAMTNIKINNKTSIDRLEDSIHDIVSGARNPTTIKVWFNDPGSGMNSDYDVRRRRNVSSGILDDGSVGIRLGPLYSISKNALYKLFYRISTPTVEGGKMLFTDKSSFRKWVWQHVVLKNVAVGIVANMELQSEMSVNTFSELIIGVWFHVHGKNVDLLRNTIEYQKDIRVWASHNMELIPLETIGACVSQRKL